MNGVNWKPVLIVICLLLGLTYLWRQSTSQDLERRNQLQATLREIELRDAELMRDLLLARAGLLPNYDALSKSVQTLEQLTLALQKAVGSATSPTEKNLIESVHKVVNALQTKLAQVEYFKSDNALLRNSVKYFDAVSHHLHQHATLKETATFGHLWQQMLSFMETPEAKLADGLEQELARLATIKPLPDDYQALITHGKMMVELVPKLDMLLRDIIRIPLSDHVAVLQADITKYSMEVEAKAQLYRFLLYLGAIILVVYLLYQFARLKASSEALRRAHHHLQQETAERVLAETALRESEERLRSMTESAHEAIISVDSFANIVSWNHGAVAMFGYSAETQLGRSLFCLFSEQCQFIQDYILGNGSDNGIAVELSGIRKDGKAFPLELSLSSWTRGADKFMTAIIRDISTRKRLEELARQQELKLIQANKMTALGTLVSGVAHEINNPNQMILLNSGLVADAWEDALEILDNHYQESGEFFLGGLPYSEMAKSLPVLIYDIKDGASRIERIVSDLKNFARPQGQGTQLLFSLNEVIERAVRLLGHLIAKKTAHFHLDLQEPMALMRGDPGQVEQVVVNLVVNALEALPDPSFGVTVTSSVLPDNQLICLEVRDEGVGIAPEYLEQLCDPFFTTKQASGGTGLGLAITASLVQAHGGRISFASELGKGTTVRAVFPESST